MRKIVNGRIYDTETAEYLCDLSPSGFMRGDFQWEDTALYRSPKGQYFLAGEGGARSRWGREHGQNGWISGSGMELIDEDRAKFLVAEMYKAEKYIELFGEPEAG